MHSDYLNSTLSNCTLMSNLLPKFKVLLKDIVSSGRYEYVVPVETKGALLFDNLSDGLEQNLFKPDIYYPRSFDFLPNKKLEGHTAAVIDDTIFSGRSMRKVYESLSRKKLNVDLYTFAVDKSYTEDKDKDKDIIEKTKYSVSLENRLEYDKYLYELKYISTLLKVPATYDHIVLSVKNVDSKLISKILNYLDKTTKLLYYGVRTNCESWCSIITMIHSGSENSKIYLPPSLLK